MNKQKKTIFINRTIVQCLVVLLIFIFCTPGAIAQETLAQPKDTASITSDTDPCTGGKRACLSMKALAAKAKADPTNEIVKTLGGIGWLEGYVVDAEKKDVLLIGRVAKNRPSLTLDDLVVNLRNIWGDANYPCISLDPRPEDIKKINTILAQSAGNADYEAMKKTLQRIKSAWGPQLTRIIGLPPNSRYANTLIAADYNMKKLSEGLYSIEGIDSALDFAARDFIHSVETTGKPPFSGVALSRFWFHVNNGEPTFKLIKNMVLIDACSICLLTEKGRAMVDGTIAYTQTEDQFALEFAQLFTERFHYIASKDPIYADLENLFRLNALLCSLKFRGDEKQAGLNLNFFLKQYRFQFESKMPATLPGLANTKDASGQITVDGETYNYTLTPLVFGGVSLDIALTASAFKVSEEPALADIIHVALTSRPDDNAVFWELP